MAAESTHAPPISTLNLNGRGAACLEQAIRDLDRVFGAGCQIEPSRSSLVGLRSGPAG
jgi:hypothetical protein